MSVYCVLVENLNGVVLAKLNESHEEKVNYDDDAY